MSISMDEDALHAAVDLVGRSGATQFEVGYLHDDVPPEEAAWWATATLRGAKLTAEDHPSPVAAAEALAVQVLSGAMCTHCGGLIALSDDGAVAYSGHLADGSEMTEQRARSMPQCRWRRYADRWERGCRDTHPDGKAPGPNRAARRAKAKGRNR